MSETPAEPQGHGVHIQAGPIDATVSIDGTPIPAGQLTGYVLEHAVGDSVPRLILHTRQPDSTTFEGFARVAVGIAQSPGELVVSFLDGVDPVLLDQAALNRADYGGGQGATARAMLATLTEWARGGTGGT
ncbi:hypothetical protein [Streptomyces sp. NPDC005548]|uniref:hypothetical protein n=1 Tax=Streptomyces sp. NPDC005548 TaxID=3364724 RepID=UPI0036821568